MLNIEKKQWQVLSKKIQTEAYRVVEAQHISSTRKLVDSMVEHDALELMLEQSKPAIPLEDPYEELHYLLFTPFRYPPLEYGSRFSGKNERSLWYGALELETALAEVAFYRFLFLFGTSEDKLKNIEVPLTSFMAEISTNIGIDLTQSPFKKDRNLISSPVHYYHSRLLGTQMRENNIEAFLYYSARRKGDYCNIGLFCPSVFKNKKPKKNSDRTWHCITTKNTVEFMMETTQEKKRICYTLEDFLVENKFPDPHAQL